MADTIVLKRSAVAAKVPLTTDLALGEVAINTYDGKMYIKKNNGTDAIVQIGSVTSVDLSGGTTGLTATGGPITSSGSLTLGGTLAIANGGTGATTAAAAFNALSPVTSTGDLIIGNGANSSTRLPIGTNGQVLTSNGTTATWAAAGGGGVTWATYTGSTAAPTVTASNNVLSLNFGVGANNIATTGTRYGAFYNGASITTSGAADRNFVVWGGADKGGTSTQRTLTMSASVDNVVIVPGASANRTVSSANVIIGSDCSGTGGQNTTIGATASNNGFYSTALGYGCSGRGNAYNVLLGATTDSRANRTISIGYQAVAAGIDAISIGAGSGQLVNTGVGQVNIGSYAQGDHAGQFCFSSGYNTTVGDTSTSLSTGRTTTTSTTPLELGFNNSAATAPTNYIVLANNTMYTFKCWISAMNTAHNGDVASWEVTFAIYRGAGAATTTLIGTPTVTSIGTGGAGSGWSVAVTADTTNGRPAIAVTGGALTIHWSASILMNKCG